MYDKVKAAERPQGHVGGPVRSAGLLNPTTKTLLRLWWPTLCIQLLWASLETAARCDYISILSQYIIYSLMYYFKFLSPS